MKKINLIIVPVDFTESTNSLREYALYMAGNFSAAIHFVHAFDFNNFSDYYAGDVILSSPVYLECEEELLSIVKREMVDLVIKTRQEGFHCTGQVIPGDPVDEILKCAQEKNADLIIISTHGRRGLEKLLLGSVAGRVVKRAHCPVLTMNPFKDFNFEMNSDDGKTDPEKNTGVAMELKENLKKLVEKLRTERDEINLKIHLGSMEAQREFEESEDKWRHLRRAVADVANDSKAISEEFVTKSKIVGDELKDTYKRIFKRLSE